MSAQATQSVLSGAGTQLNLVELLRAPYDVLLEFDLKTGLPRTLRHVEGKYFVPVIDAAVKDPVRYSAECMVHPDDRDAFIAFNDFSTLDQRLAASDIPGIIRARFRFRLLSGGWRWAEQVNVVGAEQGLPPGICYAVIYDLEPSNAVVPSGREEAGSRSALTGLLWREDFFVRGRALMRRHMNDWCMIAFDLEHFNLFNDWYGRKQGDRLLAQIGALLTRLEQEEGILPCYVGQDDFCLLTPYDMARIEALYDDIHALIKQHGTSVGFLPAFGVVPLAANPSCGIEDIFDRAALAARRAKENFHSRIRVFDPGMYEQTEKDYQILSDFQDALERRELFFMLQPQCSIDTGRVVGAESLVRWRRANGELVSPGVFVPILEEYGFITDMDKYVWEEVCAWQRRWIDGGHTPLPISVNVSQTDIAAIDVPTFFAELLKKYRLPVDVIKVEITESAYVDNDKVVDTVARLRKLGFLVLMDDFGSGYSSLNMLRSLNVDVIKLDAQFLRMGGEDRRKGLQIVEAIISMAKAMGVPIIVEGVETKEETELLSNLGCHYVQGFYFFRPMPVDDFAKLICKAENIDTGGFHFKARDEFHTREFLNEKLFSDQVLNNILGPVAFYSCRGKRIELLRYNSQFQQETHAQALTSRQKDLQELVHRDDLPLLYELMDRAVMDPIGGAGGVIRFRTSGGRQSLYRMHFYFLEQDESGRRFYGSARDLTEFITINDHMRLLSQVSTDDVIFILRRNGKRSCRVVIHSLEAALGLSREELESELNNGSFIGRVPDESLAVWTEVMADKRRDLGATALRLRGADGAAADYIAKVDYVHDESSGVDHIVSIRRFEPDTDVAEQ